MYWLSKCPKNCTRIPLLLPTPARVCQFNLRKLKELKETEAGELRFEYHRFKLKGQENAADRNKNSKKKHTL